MLVTTADTVKDGQNIYNELNKQNTRPLYRKDIGSAKLDKDIVPRRNAKPDNGRRKDQNSIHPV